MNTNSPAVDPVDRPVFVVGERPAAIQLVRALGETPDLCAMPPNRLLPDLALAVERCAADLEPLTGLERAGLRPPASWYREVQAARIQVSGKMRTVEFSGLSVQRLDLLFPGAQFLVVHQLKRRAVDRSRRLPPLGPGRILQISSDVPATAATLARVMAFIGEPAEQVLVDLSDHDAGADLVLPSKEEHMFIEER
jgi:hypothetical protein